VLPFGLTVEALAAAEAEPDPGGLAAGTRLRAAFGPELAAAAITQAVLRRRAEGKFGPRAATMFFTRDGLEQATRPAVAAHHAARFRAAGIDEVVDLGCGIGSDAIAFAVAGMSVQAIDIDSDAVAAASANLAAWGTARTSRADATEEYPRLGDASGRAWFLDPARRTGSGRVWRVSDFQPPWSLVTRVLRECQVAGVKLGPALPHALIPAGVEAEWVSHRGDTVEVGLWTGGGADPGARRAAILSDEGVQAQLLVTDPEPDLPVGLPRRFLIEPDGAVIRAGGVRHLGAQLGAALLHPTIAYLTADTATPTALGAVFEVEEVLPYKPVVLRRWLSDRQAAAIEIKKRGVDVDPAELRRRILPQPVRSGDFGWTFVITPTLRGVMTLAAHRVTKR
jgi:SAM-dependent methyltransferase